MSHKLSIAQRSGITPSLSYYVLFYSELFGLSFVEFVSTVPLTIKCVLCVKRVLSQTFN